MHFQGSVRVLFTKSQAHLVLHHTRVHLCVVRRTFFGPFAKTNQQNKTTPNFTQKKLIPYTKEQMFNVVTAVDKYKLFLPWCSDSTITSRQKNNLQAELVIGHGDMVKEKYKSNITLDEPHKVLIVANDKSLFEYLESEWHFSDGPSPKSSWVHFQISYKFKSAFHHVLMDRVFLSVQQDMIKAFEKRCHQIYDNDNDNDNNDKTKHTPKLTPKLTPKNEEKLSAFSK